jgi:hypothetical protein
MGAGLLPRQDGSANLVRGDEHTCLGIPAFAYGLDAPSAIAAGALVFVAGQGLAAWRLAENIVVSCMAALAGNQKHAILQWPRPEGRGTAQLTVRTEFRRLQVAVQAGTEALPLAYLCLSDWICRPWALQQA